MPDKAKKTETLQEDQIASYLAENPDFFRNRDDLISKLKLPHKNGQAISLIERQVSILRERNLESRKKNEALLSSAARNSEIFDSCRKLILALIESKDSKQFFQALDLGFKDEFGCTAHHLLLYGNPDDGEIVLNQFNHFISILPVASVKSHLDPVLNNNSVSGNRRNPYLGVLKEELQDFLFQYSSSKVKSAAVLSIATEEKELGVLSIGSGDSNYFVPGMGTLFLGFIADALANLLPKYVYLQGNDKR